jgi:DNA ligase (NAD+)
MDNTLLRPEGSILEGLRFVLTGRLHLFSRSQAEQMIKKHGGVISGTVSHKTDYLVLGKDPGSKLYDANRLGIKTLNEEEFSILIEKGQLGEL